MSDKIKKLSFLLLFSFLIISCSGISEKKLAGTKWTNKDGTVICHFTSRNTIEITFSGIIKKYWYYVEGNEIKITCRDDYSQSIITFINDELIIKPEVVNGTVTSDIKLSPSTGRIQDIAQDQGKSLNVQPAENQPAAGQVSESNTGIPADNSRTNNEANSKDMTLQVQPVKPLKPIIPNQTDQKQ